MTKPVSRIIGITMGCPVGVGPEIVLRFLAENSLPDCYFPVVLGDMGILRRCADKLAIPIDIVPWAPGEAVKENCINVLSLSALLSEEGGDHPQWGKPTRQTGMAMAAYIEEAARLCMDGTLAGMVTCPITKTALRLAEYPYPGHTEMLAAICDCQDFAMMMAGDKLRVSLVTIHMALADVPAALTRSEISRIISLTGRSLQRDFGIERPRIAVAGLNPHAGEGGMFGDEEECLIRPVIIEALADGWQIEGPLPPDTVYFKAVAGAYDAVVSMYHDQGLIPFKLIHFRDGVNVTLGLPIVRTSVDHGTAYDIAGKGVASSESLRAAFFMAAEIATHRSGQPLNCEC
jgi:4-hydroxythreonine-4-phosphate dehydrogenase